MPDYRLLYRRWNEVIANFESLTIAEQERVSRHSTQIVVFENQATKIQAHPVIQQIGTPDQKKN